MSTLVVPRHQTGSGWSLMDQLMRFGSKTWTPCWMTTRSCVSCPVKLYKCLHQWVWYLSRWIWRLLPLQRWAFLHAEIFLVPLHFRPHHWRVHRQRGGTESSHPEIFNTKLEFKMHRHFWTALSKCFSKRRCLAVEWYTWSLTCWDGVPCSSRGWKHFQKASPMNTRNWSLASLTGWLLRSSSGWGREALKWVSCLLTGA